MNRERKENERRELDRMTTISMPFVAFAHSEGKGDRK
jgi:hypothetical protein